MPGLGLSVVAQSLKESDKSFATSFRKGLRETISKSSSDLLGEVRARSSWSSRIPSAVNIAVTFSTTRASVNMKVNARKAPHARGLELGNSASFNESEIEKRGGYRTVTYTDKQGNKRARRVANDRKVYAAMKTSGSGGGRALRHPVFGHPKGDPTKWGWSTMPTRPFFFPGINAKLPGIDSRFNQIIDQAAHDAGFK